MALTWNQQSNLWQLHPLIDYLYGLLGGETVAWQPRIRVDAYKC